MAASNTIEIKIIGKNEAGAVIAEVNGNVETLGKTSSSTAKFGMTELLSSLNLAKEAFSVVSGAITGAINEMVDYSNSVQDTAMMLGITNEEASTLIQVADDARISVGELTTAFRNAAKDGITPNIDTLIELGAQYKAIQDPAERLAFVMDTFGARGTAMARILSLSADEIANMASEAEAAGLVMSDDMVAGAEDARLAIDSMEDSVAGLKLSLAAIAGPGFAAFTSGAAQLVQSIGPMVTYTSEFIAKLGELDFTIGGVAGGMVRIIDGSLGLYSAAGDVGEAIGKERGELQLLTAELEKAGPPTYAYAGAVWDGAEALAYWNAQAAPGATTTLTTAIGELAGEYNEAALMSGLLADGLDILSDSMIQQQKDAALLAYWTGELTLAEYQARLASISNLEVMQNMNAALEAGTVSQNDYFAALSDGIVTQEELDTALAKSSTSYADAAAASEAAADAIVLSGEIMASGLAPTAAQIGDILLGLQQIDGMEVNAYVTIETTGGNRAAPGTAIGFASGGSFDVPPGYPNDSYPMMVESGEHVEVTPAGMDEGGTRKNYTINIYDTTAAKMFLEQQRLEDVAGFEELMG